MKHRTLLSVLVMMGLVAMAGCSSGVGQASSLINVLTSTLGLTQNQAVAGAGSLLGLASEKLGAQDYAKIAGAIPGSSDLVKQAGDLTGLGKNFGSLAIVTSALGKMGISSSQVTSIGSSMADFAGKSGGESTKNLLLSALK